MSDSRPPIRVLYVAEGSERTEQASTSLAAEDPRITVTTAGGAADAEAVLRDGDVDCVVCAGELSESDGLGVLERVRDDRPDISVIVFPAEGSESLAADAMAAGATDYLPRAGGDDAWAVLADRIERAVDRSSATPADAETDRLETFLEQSTDVICVLGPDGTVNYVSPSVERILGWEPSEIVGEDAFSFAHPEDRAATMEAFTEAVEDPSHIPTVEYRFRHPDGSWTWVESRGNNQLDNEAIGGFVVNTREIEDRIERERELERVRDRMEFALRSTDAIVWDWNVDEDHATFYPSEEEFYGTSVDSLDDFMELIHLEDRQTVRDAVERALETGVQKDEEVRIVVDGEVRWIHAPGRPVEDEDGTTHMVGIVRDITDRKENERALERQNERLEEFTSVVSHDLRTPLSVATGRLELAREECDSDHLDQLGETLEHMGDLLDELLTLAKAGTEAQEPEPVDLAACCEDAWGTVESGAASLDVETDLSLTADRTQLRQLLSNLFQNAADHAGEEATVTVGELPNGFYVADDGPGIPPEEREDVFEAGYSTGDGGTGFGLGIVKRIAETHDWAIEVTESQAGGTRFEITGLGSIPA